MYNLDTIQTRCEEGIYCLSRRIPDLEGEELRLAILDLQTMQETLKMAKQVSVNFAYLTSFCYI